MSKNGLQVQDFLTGYEARIYKGYKKTVGDSIKDKKLISSTVREALQTNVEVEINGERLEIPLIYNLIALKLEYLKEHPDKIDLKELSTVLGEQKQEVVIETQSASEIFAGVAIGREIDDSCIE